MDGPEKTSTNQENIALMEQIRNCASLAYDVNRTTNQLLTVNTLLAQRSMLAFYIYKGLLKNDTEGIQQFKYYTEQIKKHLNL